MSEHAFPLQWPLGWKRCGYRTWSKFGERSIDKATTILLAELRRLGAVHPVISANLILRKDGLPHSGQPRPNEQAFAGYMALEERTGPSCFEILGISSDATEQQILDAWRRKVKETHPDHGGSSEAFTQVNQAKDIAFATRRSK